MGGGEMLAVRLAGARARGGFGSYLYVLGGPGPLSDRIDPAVGVRYLDLVREPVSRPWRLAVSVGRGIRTLRRHLDADGIDVVQCHLPAANFWGLALAELRVRPVVATVHSTREFDYGTDNPVWKRRLRKAAYRRLLRRCNAVVAVSDGVRDALLAELDVEAFSARRLDVIPNAVDVLPPADRDARIAGRRALDLPDDLPLVVGAGRLVPLKGFDRLIRSAAQLRSAGHRFGLVIAGDGPMREELEHQVSALRLESCVRLPGNCDLTRLLPVADVFALASDYEGLPLVLLEAMGAGLPVVATRLAGLDDLVEASGAGILVNSGDVNALAAGLGELLDDPHRRCDVGRRARDLIRERHAFAAGQRRYDALYADLMEAPGVTSC